MLRCNDEHENEKEDAPVSTHQWLTTPTLIFNRVKMAALRIFARPVLSTCQQYSKGIDRLSLQENQLQPRNEKRWASFKTSPVYNEEKKYTDFEVSKDPKEWMFVERCVKLKHIPNPPKNIENLPSGWKAQRDEAKSFPYYIERSKNHQQPVYLKIDQRGLRRVTYVRKIQGDIIVLHAELKQYLRKSTGRPIGSQILEPNGVLRFRGDQVSLIKEWLSERGF
ncbi:probable 39S ribosomal protein L49, mitochondrial [Fopius arisanus]|uniref:Large ribosomal subunit protein mL49 n=1 Tax=Fopius arisanus TaxID=64838 RepID=A0A9R1TPE2_9HYME|nr:PREDICTED: probable 39S ribosomal protein L49, mitochondrial [Fopius arisanus]